MISWQVQNIIMEDDIFPTFDFLLDFDSEEAARQYIENKTKEFPNSGVIRKLIKTTTTVEIVFETKGVDNEPENSISTN